MSLAAVSDAHAGWVSAGSPLCITQSVMENYRAQAAAGEVAFNNDLLDRAACYITQEGQEVLVTSKSGGLLEVKTPGGYKMWVVAADYSDEAPKLDREEKEEAEEDMEVIAQTVAEKPTWYDKMKAYFSWK